MTRQSSMAFGDSTLAGFTSRLTFSYKDKQQLDRGTHVASHSYVLDKDTLELIEATHAEEKPDSTRKKGGKAVWPASEELWEGPEIGYSHLEGLKDETQTRDR
ncbi:hypothetical protein B0J18DRAFT_437468 [Chaetomium sp. MPI-SDFR-AT-0129]|nr:hypothetical protein B0J18DRAFT_437468 [Chaetomium sp. MPI-SDFR-AT-0129]